jgi:hypothetical protein
LGFYNLGLRRESGGGGGLTTSQQVWYNILHKVGLQDLCRTDSGVDCEKWLNEMPILALGYVCIYTGRAPAVACTIGSVRNLMLVSLRGGGVN